MSEFNAPGPSLSKAERYLLGYLNEKWPTPVTVTPHTTTFVTGFIPRIEFVEIMQALNDNGLISYEAFLMQSSLGVRFIGATITAKGKSALQAAAAHA
jgi:hypothetical protein